MSEEFFKNLPDTSTPLNASRLNGLLNGNESMGKIMVEDVKCKNLFNKNNFIIDLSTALAFNISSLEMGKTYIFSSNLPIKSFKISNYADGSNSVAKDEENGFTTFTFTMNKSDGIPSEKKQYLFLAITDVWNWVKNISELDGYELQIEEGTTATEYTPYKNFDNTEYVLYDNENGSYDSIVLSDSVTNYKYIEIFFCAENNHNSLKVYNPNEKNVYLGIDVIYSDAAYVKKSKWWILNNSIEIGVAFNYTVENLNRITSADNSPSVAITRVVGYK